MDGVPPELLQTLQQLEYLRETNPAAFEEAMQSLGYGGEEIPDRSFLSGTDSTALHKMAEAIQSMRRESSGPDDGQSLNIGKDKPAMKGIEITPTAGFTFKTTRLSDRAKVFVNVVQHELVAEPAMKKKLNEDGEEVEGMNIPMSVGPPRSGSDKKGAACSVYDIIVHPSVIKDSTEDKSGRHREFICQLAIQYLEQKYKEVLNKQYKLPNLKYKGDSIPSQVIQDRKNMPKIEEVRSSSNSAASAGEQKRAAKKKLNTKRSAVQPTERDLLVHGAWLRRHDMRVESSEFAIFDIPTCEQVECVHSLQEYVDPVHEPEDGVEALMLYADVSSYEMHLPQLSVNVSPFRVTVHHPEHKKILCYLPCAILPAFSYFTLSRPYEGCLSMVRINIVLRVDRRSFTEAPDAGSRPWLVSQALSGGGDYPLTATGVDGRSSALAENPYAAELSATIRERQRAASLQQQKQQQDEEVFAEDKFHLRLPEDVDPYTGVKLDGEADPFLGKGGNAHQQPQQQEQVRGSVDEEEEEFPEDKFHRKDASSQFMINQREQARKDKWEKHEREKKERDSDPNVEYIDMEDFRPGGKYGPKEDEAQRQQRQTAHAQSEEMKRAATLVAESQQLSVSGGLSSSLWTELLD